MSLLNCFTKFAFVSLVSQDFLNAGITVKNRLQRSDSNHYIGSISRADKAVEDQAKGIYNNMTLATFDTFVAIYTLVRPLFSTVRTD